MLLYGDNLLPHQGNRDSRKRFSGKDSQKTSTGSSNDKTPIMDEKVMQQLRGIFAAHDEDKDLKLNQT